MYPNIDEKIMLEKRYGGRSPLPIYNAKHNIHHEQSRTRTRRSVITYLILVAGIFFTVIYAVPTAMDIIYPARFAYTSSIPAVSSDKLVAHEDELPFSPATSGDLNHTLVPLEAHIMSKCPDARDCLRDLVVPAMEKVFKVVDFRLSYIGSIDSSDNLHCMHGQTECLGNMLGLCAAELYPDDIKISLGFSTCMIMKYQLIPGEALVKECAMEHGVDFEKLNDCVSEEGKGLDLLEQSIQRSEAAGVKKSCTVRVGGEKWCVRDGGEWKDCEGGHEVDDLVGEIERRWKAT